MSRKWWSNVQGDSRLFDEQVQLAPSETKDGGWDTVDDIKDINLGVIEDLKPIFVGALI